MMALRIGSRVPNKQFEVGRRCVDCGCVLSRYNEKATCATHTPVDLAVREYLPSRSTLAQTANRLGLCNTVQEGQRGDRYCQKQEGHAGEHRWA